MRTKVKAVFDQIEAMVAEMSHEERQDLWALVTLQRGPDDEDEARKATTTAVVRRETLPTLARSAGAKVAIEGAPFGRTDNWLTVEDHFEVHAGAARDALEMTDPTGVYGLAREICRVLD